MESEAKARSPRKASARAYGRSGLGPTGTKPAEGICKRIRHAVKPFAGVLRSQRRACDGVAKRHGRRAAGAQ
jgi:hypothetical protein